MDTTVEGTLVVGRKREEQVLFDFYVYDKPCRSCAFSQVSAMERGWKWGCGVGQIRLTSKVRKLPNECRCWKGGESLMPFIDFRKLSEEEARQELERIRRERSGSGKKRRVASREKRIKASKVREEGIRLDIEIEE